MENTMNQKIETAARERVSNSDALSAHSETIWSDWSNMNDHVEWIANATEAEIVAWAEGIGRDADASAVVEMQEAL